MPTIHAWVCIINLCMIAALVGIFALGTNDMNSFLCCSLWLGSPYLGHCGLALTCRRHRGASVLVLAWTLVSVAIALRFFVFPPAGIASADGQDDENGLGFVMMVLPVLQWIAVVVLGIVLMLLALARASGPPPKPKVPPLGDLE